MHFIYYINRSNATKVDSNLFGLLTNSTQRICLVARAGFDTHSTPISSRLTLSVKQLQPVMAELQEAAKLFMQHKRLLTTHIISYVDTLQNDPLNQLRAIVHT